MLAVGSYRRVVEFPTNEALGVEDGVGGVHGDLVLCRVSYEALRVGEGDVAGGCPVTLVVGYDLHFTVLEDADAGVSGPEIYPDGWASWSFCHFR